MYSWNGESLVQAYRVEGREIFYVCGCLWLRLLKKLSVLVSGPAKCAKAAAHTMSLLSTHVYKAAGLSKIVAKGAHKTASEALQSSWSSGPTGWHPFWPAVALRHHFRQHTRPFWLFHPSRLSKIKWKDNSRNCLLGENHIMWGYQGLTHNGDVKGHGGLSISEGEFADGVRCLGNWYILSRLFPNQTRSELNSLSWVSLSHGVNRFVQENYHLPKPFKDRIKLSMGHRGGEQIWMAFLLRNKLLECLLIQLLTRNKCLLQYAWGDHFPMKKCFINRLPQRTEKEE